MDFRVLGRIEVVGPNPTSSPPGAKERAILARLLVDAGRTVPADALGVPVGTIMSRLARGRERVVRTLQPAEALVCV